MHTRTQRQSDSLVWLGWPLYHVLTHDYLTANPQVFVNWTEIPGSKIRFTSILLMATELLILKVAYQVLGVWPIRTELVTAQAAGGAAAKKAN